MFKYVEYIKLFLILLLASIITFALLSRYIDFNTNNMIIVDNDVITSPKIIIDKNEINNTDISLDGNNESDNIFNNINNYYKLSFAGRSYLLSNDKDSYTYGFISKQIINNVLYLYSHNSYKFTENSGYYLYNKLKLHDTITFNNEYKYQIVKTDMVNFDETNIDKVKLLDGVNIVYFTCTPHGNNLRKLYQLKKL